MWFLYLDESGDLGFDFVNKKPSKYFTITILALSGVDKNRALINAVAKTAKRKLRKDASRELKGSKTALPVKEYFYKQVASMKFAIYSITLNKIRVFERLRKDKARVYNYVARLVLDKIPFENAPIRVELIIDKSKGKIEVQDFNQYIFAQLKGRLDPKVPLDIYHRDSCESIGLQAVDLFCWGIFRKYERKDLAWHDIFKDKVILDTLYLS